jgi:5-formyltetrahydrofolate cyclo-ligase
VPPNKIDVVFLPLLAFGIAGYRVGYGKGYCDRFLAQCKPETLKIGVSIFEPVEHISNREPHDVRMDYCITPSTIYSF